MEILNAHDIDSLETADDGEIEDLTDKISLFLSNIADDHERQAGQGIVSACYELLIIPVKAKLEPNLTRINYLEIPENLKVNRKTIYKLIKNRVKLIDPQIIENYLSNIDNTGYQSINDFRLKFKDIDSAKAFHLGNKLLNAQRLTADEKETATQLENLFNTPGQFRLFSKDILNAIIAHNDSNGNPLTVNDNHFLVKIVKSILTKSLNRYLSQRETEPYDIVKFERGLILLRNKPEIREKVYLMIDSLQTDMHNLIFVLGKLKSLSMMEDRINLKQVEIEGLSKELDFI